MEKKSIAVRDGIAVDLHLVSQQVLFSKNSYLLRFHWLANQEQFGWVGSQKCLVRCSIVMCGFYI